jgi:asparagine synthase (glutamine-hydrolysing)
MCGIAAIISTRTPLATAAVRRMVAALEHRGPDNSGQLTVAPCHLGHTRLTVIDPTGGVQPMSDPSGRFHISFNGEIFNFQDIRKELERDGVAFATRSDTETLLLAYRQWGDAVVQRLNGQFAFVIWDSVEQRLFAARDRLGEKPLYFAESPTGEVLFASEIKAILATGLVRPMLDFRAVDAYLELNYVPPCITIYENIQTLEPAHTLVWQGGRISCQRYWSPQLSTINITAEEAAREVRRRLEVAVERQMIADTTVGAFLSGGLDSSTIVALMTRFTRSKVRTFAAGFGDLINELPFARAVANEYGTNHSENHIQINIAARLQEMAEVYDEPFGDSSNIPTYLISEFARHDVKVVLSGDGGDELFGGYAWYQPLLHHDALPDSLTAYWQNKIAAKTCGLLSAVGLPLKQRRERARSNYKWIGAKRAFPDLWDRHVATLGCLSPSARHEWHTNRTGARRLVADHYSPNESLQGIDRAVDFDLRCYLPGDILVKVDRAAMAHGLETRSPFLDVELVEFVLSLPANVRFEQGRPKSLLRRACEDLWPEPIKHRGKQGFGAPLGNWLQQPAVQELRQRVFCNGSPLAELLPAARSLSPTTHRHSQMVWNLLCLGLWLEKHSVGVKRLPLAA